MAESWLVSNTHGQVMPVIPGDNEATIKYASEAIRGHQVPMSWLKPVLFNGSKLCGTFVMKQKLSNLHIKCWEEVKAMTNFTDAGIWLWKTIWQFLIKVNTHLPQYPAIPVLGIYLREMKTHLHIKICTRNL